jgi:hypothetical protein
VRKHLVQLCALWAVALIALVAWDPASVKAQAANDTSCVSPLRPRYGTYLIQTFPNPSSSRSPVTIQFYNHNPEIIAVKIFDLRNSLIMVLHEKQQTDRGLHTYTIQPGRIASGTYYIRLTTYTASGAELTTDNARFVIVH